MNISLAIADADREYAERLSEVLQQYKDLTISIFTSPEKLQTALEHSRFDILLFDPDISPERLAASRVKLAICLYRDDSARMGMYADCPKVLKYQRISHIYRDVLREYAEIAGASVDFGSRMSTKLIGVYSPAGGAGKTTIALAIACKIKALGNSVLFVNTEPLESSSVINPHNEDSIAMLVEDVHNENVNFRVKLTALSKHGIDDVEYLEGFARLVDYDAVTGEEIAGVLNRIKRESDFGYVVIDMASGLDSVNKAVFELADQIVLVEKPGELPQQKLALFMQQVFVQDLKNKLLGICNFAENVAPGCEAVDVPVIGKIHNYGNMKLESLIHAINANGEYAPERLIG